MLLTRRVAERDAQGRAVALAGISLNVTAQRAEQDRAEALAEHARLVAEAMSVGLWSRDVETEVVKWDEQMYRIYRRDPALGAPSQHDWARVCVHPQDRAWVVERLQHGTERWEPMTELTFRSLDDAHGQRWVQAWVRRVEHQGRRTLFGTHMDVSERQRAQGRVEHERARTRFALDAADLGVWERDAAGKLVYWNQGMYRLRGLEPTDPRSPEELAHLFTDPADLARLASLFRRHIDHGEPYRMELRVPLAGGAERWVLTQGHALRDPEGRALGMIGVHVDITERKQAEAMRHEKERIERAIRDKSAFMARMSHELRTPMNAVLGFTRLLQEDTAEPMAERHRERLAHIADAATQLLGMVDDVLQVARRDGAAQDDAATPAQAAIAPATAPAPAAHEMDVLCIEDNPVNLQLVRELMSLRPGVRLQTAVDGRSGIAAARRMPPRLLLLDLHLPDLHGIDVLRELKPDPALARCLFVALSADAMPEHIEAARAAGFDDYWTKPIDFDRFLADIDRIAAGE
ncbi:MAG: PAS domain S-box protein [Chitinophagaceae bacterium]|nr:PAS domain S-box protein [Rubrivivax sp.]